MSDHKGRMCPSLGVRCHLEWCRSNGMCKNLKGYIDDPVGHVTTTEAEQRAMTSATGLSYRACPGAALGEAKLCHLPECLEGECAKKSVLVRPNAQGWMCPTDKKHCSMFSCEGGMNCSLKRSGTPVYANYSPCHSGLCSLGFINKAELFVGRESDAKYWDVTRDGPLALVIGLLGDPFSRGKFLDMNEQAKSVGLGMLSVSVPVPPNIWIRWPDYGVVPLGRPWWEVLVKHISTLDGAVIVYCLGGHGRSGTAAAIMGALGGLVPEDIDPVAWVRGKHCSKAVESAAQAAYVEAMTGRKVSANGSKTTSNVVWSSAGKGSSDKRGSKKNDSGASKGVMWLSIRKFKRWWRNAPKQGEYFAIKDITRPKDLPDGQTFVISSKTWKWVAKDNGFVEVVTNDAK